MSSASVSIIRTCVHYGRRMISRLGQGSMILVWAVSASAQTPGTSTSQVCTQDPTYTVVTPVRGRARRRAVERAVRRRAAVRVAPVRAEEPEPTRRRPSPTPHAATVSPWMRGVPATEWQSDTCAVGDRRGYRHSLQTTWKFGTTNALTSALQSARRNNLHRRYFRLAVNPRRRSLAAFKDVKGGSSIQNALEIDL
jgi:hypothetical protein